MHCVHKKGSTQDCGNYRQISLLNIQSSSWKVLLVFNLILFVTNTIHLLPPNGVSERVDPLNCCMLFSMTEKWRLALDERKLIGIIFIDLQKAFDIVSRQILPKKLQASGLCGRSMWPSKTFQRLCLCPLTVLLVTPLTPFPNPNSKSSYISYLSGVKFNSRSQT